MTSRRMTVDRCGIAPGVCRAMLVFTGVLVLSAGWSSAGMADDLASAFATCRAITDNVARLACFDHLEVPSNNAARAHREPRPTEQDFGLAPIVAMQREVQRVDVPAPVEALDSKLIALTVNPTGRAVFTLENGQVWRQVVPGDDLLLRVGDVVRLSKGALGSYWLKAPNDRNCKVTRIR